MPARPVPALRAVAAGALSAASVLTVAAPSGAAPAERPLVIGHRGAAGTAPENTVAAFEDARAAGADYLEIDVQLSADGVPFLFHDDTPARTTDVADVFPGRENDPVTSFTWAELQQLDAGSSFGARFAGERIPHFDDAARIATVDTGVYIEIKSPRNSPGIERVVADALAGDESWAKLLAAGKVTVIGFDEGSNRVFAELAPGVPLQQLTGSVPDAATIERWAGFADSVGTDYRALDADDVARVDAAGLDLGVYTVNSPEAVRHVLDLGVDMVTGDFPSRIERLLGSRAPFSAGHGVESSGAVDDVPGDDVPDDDVRHGTGEHVVPADTGTRTVGVGGWILRAAANDVLTADEAYEPAPGARLRVHTGPGTGTGNAFHHGGASPVLDDGGDSVAPWTDEDTLPHVFAH